MRGAHNLTDTELVAILLRTGTKGKSVLDVARELVKCNNNISMLASLSLEALQKVSGIGADKAATLAAAFELSRRIEHQKKWLTKKRITVPSEVGEMFVPLLRDELKEKFIVICLNSANKIIKYEVISVGSLNSSIVHAREVFKVAIDCNSANIILIHNHPSGNCDPSREDIKTTKQLVEAGKILGIQVFDHLIVGGDDFFSMVERKLI